MLILTRRVGESVKIGDEVTVTVLGMKGSHVRLEFEAPKDVAVHREEIYERVHAVPTGFAQAVRARSLSGNPSPLADRIGITDRYAPSLAANPVNFEKLVGGNPPTRSPKDRREMKFAIWQAIARRQAWYVIVLEQKLAEWPKERTDVCTDL